MLWYLFGIQGANIGLSPSTTYLAMYVVEGGGQFYVHFPHPLVHMKVNAILPQEGRFV